MDFKFIFRMGHKKEDMKKMIVLSISLLLIVFVCFFLRDRDKIVVFSCPDDCEIGCLSGHFVEIEFINQLLLPVLYDRTDCFDDAQLKPIQSLSEDLNGKLYCTLQQVWSYR